MEIKNKCDIVSDLLLGYADGVLTDKSKEFVSRHKQTCDKCKEKLSNIVSDIKAEKEDSQELEIDYLKNVRKKITKKNKFIIIIGSILMLVVTLNIMIFINYNMNANKIEVFLKDSITEEEMKEIKNAILMQDSKAEITYISPEDAVKNAIQTFENAGYLEAANGFNIERDKSRFPASYKIKTKVENIEKIEHVLMSFEGIRTMRSSTIIDPYLFFINRLSI